MTDKELQEIVGGIKDGLKSTYADNALAAALQDLLALRAAVRRERQVEYRGVPVVHKDHNAELRAARALVDRLVAGEKE